MADTEERVFSITTTGEEKTSALLKRGKYDWADSAIGDDLFPIEHHEPKEREIVLITFQHDPTSEEVLAEFKRRGLERPTPEDAFVFGVTYPDEQKKQPVVFLHKPVRVLGHRHVLVLCESARERYLYLSRFDLGWTRDYVFAAVRPSTRA